MGLVRDPAQNQVIELPGWFVRGGDDVRGVGAAGLNRSAADELIDERHEVFQVPFGAARPANRL